MSYSKVNLNSFNKWREIPNSTVKSLNSNKTERAFPYLS